MNPSDSTAWLNNALPFFSIEITLKFICPTRLPRFHRARLTDFVRTLINSKTHPYAGRLLVESAEDGKTFFRPGERYRFGVTVFPEALDWLERLMRELEGLPGSASRSRKNTLRPFRRDNLRLVSIRDRLDWRELLNLRELIPYNTVIFRHELDLWDHYMRRFPLTWRWLSPVRIGLPKAALKPENSRQSKDRYCSDPRMLDAVFLLHRNMESIRALVKHRGYNEPDPAPPVPELDFLYRDLFWIEDSYRSGAGRKYLSGLMGEVRFPPMPGITRLQTGCIVLGQYLGMGEQPAFGMGRYHLETADSKTTNVVSPLVP